MRGDRWQTTDDHCGGWENAWHRAPFCDNHFCVPCRALATVKMTLHYPSYDFKFCDRHAEQARKCPTYQGEVALELQVSHVGTA